MTKKKTHHRQLQIYKTATDKVILMAYFTLPLSKNPKGNPQMSEGCPLLLSKNSQERM